jgi:type II restriction enzyme
MEDSASNRHLQNYRYGSEKWSNARVDLNLPSAGLDRYKSASQRARVATELWGARNLYCASCKSPRLRPMPHNTAAIDYVCSVCQSPFQLKSQSRVFGRKIVDAAYSKMRRAIVEDRTPNLYILHYDLPSWKVETLILIPRFAFTLSALESRKPLGPTARRAGWVGCNILLDRIPSDARIAVIHNGQALPNRAVRHEYDRLRPLQELDSEKRGWTLDVLQIIRSLEMAEFTLRDAYAHAKELTNLHPKNFHVHEKIRQQLQVLRDLGVIDFLGRGNYRLR